MLAKIVKSDSLAEYAPFDFPVLGGGDSPAKNQERFVVPEISQLGFFHEEPTAEEIAAQSLVVPTPKIEDVLQNARDEAARIIARAEQDAAAIAQAAAEKIETEIYSRFESEVAAKTDEVRVRLTETIEQITALAETISARHEKDLVELALQIAKRIVGREVTIDREIAFTLVKVSLSKLHNRAVAEVHLNPEDFNFVQTHREKLDFRGALELIEDKSITVGGCLIHTETGDIDARIESQFDEIAHGLLEG